ncbi:extensin family protein [Sphingomonas sp. BN140010]|uniref:Extensin family protein n=1 Tax=Sphingomonas arvum TaxID=2992113 RepID=A0ABT3JHZ8_9SPHN|nr:extensin family protein [Sphingomonas sp. BN140010]MCW3798574.1 extensin family protein [Sphingomonas sp. BN140010]
MVRAVRWFLLFCVLAVAVIELKARFDRRPQDLPWTALRLDDPVGRFTAGKIAALGEAPAQCRALLAAAGTRDRAAPPRRPAPTCGYDDGMILAGGNARQGGFAPAGLVTSCPVATALLLWDERVVQPAARRHFGTSVTAFSHAGSFSCRRLYGRASGAWSEHATADAVDILGFRLTDGRTVSVLRDWPGSGQDAAFLRDARDGACRLFTTVLSPDYNAAHRDHLHLDTAYRGPGGWRACR